MILEEQLSNWTEPSSANEQDKQDRTERMIREAIDAHAAFVGCDRKVYVKGSYANNTNVRADSDVDIAVQVTEALYWDETAPGRHPDVELYKGVWTPAKLRTELVLALKAKFVGQVDDSGTTAISIRGGSARVKADVVPCFSFTHYYEFEAREGTKIFKKDGSFLINYPSQQLEKGRAKNVRTGLAYKKGARLLKRVENAMADDGTFRELPSFFVECLAYNCPDEIFRHPTWTECLRQMLLHIWNGLQGDDEPATTRWLESNECYYLFRSTQKWTRADGREFAKAAWNYFEFKS